MRDLNKDLEWLSNSQRSKDLSDNYLLEANPFNTTRLDYNDHAPDLVYGITFVESEIAREWLERAIKAENNYSIKL